MSYPYNQKRNQEIYEKVMKDQSYVELAKEYNTTRQNIYRIFWLHFNKLKKASKS